MKYLTDGKRHLICEPYSIENLHKMADNIVWYGRKDGKSKIWDWW